MGIPAGGEREEGEWNWGIYFPDPRPPSVVTSGWWRTLLSQGILTFSFLVPLTTLFLHSPSSRNSNSCIPYSLPNTKHTFKNSPFANTLSLKYPDLSVPSVSLWVPVLETVSVPPRCLLLGQCTPLLLCLLLMAYNCTLLQRVAFGLRSQVGQKCLGS